MTPYTGGMMNQQATYWSPATIDVFNQRSYGAPVLIACRWQDTVSRVVGPSGEDVTTNSIAYVDRPLEAGGILALGDFTGSATPVEYGRPIQATGNSPSLDATEALYKVWL